MMTHANDCDLDEDCSCLPDVMLTAADWAMIDAHEQCDNWCDYDIKSPDGCHPHGGCTVWARRDALAAGIKVILRRHLRDDFTQERAMLAECVELLDATNRGDA